MRIFTVLSTAVLLCGVTAFGQAEGAATSSHDARHSHAVTQSKLRAFLLFAEDIA
jgi:hypothetical protein